MKSTPFQVAFRGYRVAVSELFGPTISCNGEGLSRILVTGTIPEASSYMVTLAIGV